MYLCLFLICFEGHEVTSSGVNTIIAEGGKPIKVLCDMMTEGGGWTVFQRRMDESVDFYPEWTAYKTGFGNLCGEFWLGNDNLHGLTAAEEVELRVDLEDFEGNITYAEYTTFKVADEEDKYRLLIGGYNRIRIRIRIRRSALLSTERLQTHVFTMITKIFVQ